MLLRFEMLKQTRIHYDFELLYVTRLKDVADDEPSIQIGLFENSLIGCHAFFGYVEYRDLYSVSEYILEFQ